MPVAASRIPRAPEVFVGRQGMLDRIIQHLNRRRIVLLNGVAGVGKSALVLTLLQRLKKQAGRPLFYHVCQPGDNGQTLALALGLVSPPEIAVREQILEVIEAVNKANALLVIEDFQHLAPGHAAVWIRSMQAYLHAQVVVTSRAEIPLQSLEKVDLCREKLEPLDSSSALTLLQEILEAHGLPGPVPGELQKLANLVDGHPLLLKLLTGCWLSGHHSGPKPPEIRDFVVHELIGNLPVQAQGDLELLAVAGRPIPLSCLADPQGSLDILASRYLIERDGALVATPRLVAEWLTPEVPAQRQAALHLLLAPVLENSGQADAAFYHYYQAGELAEAEQILTRSCAALCSQSHYENLAQSVEALYSSRAHLSPQLVIAYTHALSNLGRGEECLKILDDLKKTELDSVWDLAVRAAHAGAYLNHGLWKEALQIYRQILSTGPASVESDHFLKAVNYAALIHGYRGELLSARRVLALIQAPAGLASAHRMRVEALLYHFEGDPERALASAQAALSLARQHSSAKLAELCRHAMGLAWCDLREFTKARECLQGALSEARRWGDMQVASYCLLASGRLERESGDVLAAEKAFAAAEDLFRHHGHRHGTAMARYQRLSIEAELGRLDIAGWERCLRVSQECGDPRLEAELQILLARFEAGQGQGRRSQTAAHRAQEILDTLDLPWLRESLSKAADRPAVATLDVQEQSIEVQCLGGLRLSGPLGVLEEDDWPSRKAASLFALLCCGQRSPRSSLVVASQLWPEASQDNARNSLRNAIHHLRSALRKVAGDAAAEGLVRSRKNDTLSLQGIAQSDLETFQQRCAQASQSLLQADPQRAIAVLTPVPQEDLLESFREEWVDGLRTSYHELRVRAYLMLSQAQLALSQGIEAERACRAGLALDDLREELHVGLMEALLGQNRRAEALRYYKDTLMHFEQELGMIPRSFESIFPRLIL